MNFKNLENEKKEFLSGIKLEVPITDKNKEDLKNTIEKELSKEQSDELENIVEEAIKEIETKEENVETLECRELLLIQNKYLLDIKRDNNENVKKTTEKQDSILSKMAQHNKLTILTVFAAGVVFGMADAKWLPYASYIYELAKEILLKGGN